MQPVELAATVLVVGMLAIGWTDHFLHRQSLPRLWALIARKPHETRRGYHVRRLIFAFTTMWMAVSCLTAMVVAMLLAIYLVEVERWPDGIGVGLFLGTGACGLAWKVVSEMRLARRLGLHCPRCEAAWTRQAVVRMVVKSGECAYCSTVVFHRRTAESTTVKGERGR